MMSMMENPEGIKFEFAVPISQKCQLGLGWNFATTKTSRFESTLMIMGSTPSAMQMQEEMMFAQLRTDSNGRMEVSGSMPLGAGFNLKAEGFYMDANVDQAQLSGELTYECNPE